MATDSPKVYDETGGARARPNPVVDLLMNREAETVMRAATSTSETLPDGWPPSQPVELMRVARRFVVWGAIFAALCLAGIAWVAIEVRTLRHIVATQGR